jgi:DNA polymerase-2
MASFFGVLASPNCRYFNLNIANAITHFGQSIIKLTAKEIENKFKVKVIYSDTDSVFVETNLSKEKANALAKEIQDFINSYYENYAKKNFQRISFLELQFEKQYLYLMIPAIRKKDEEETAAKKRYAGLIEKDGKEILEIVGLEAIRGDWTEAAKEFQRELLAKIFHNEKVEPFIKDYIKKIKEGELDKQLIYKKSIRKELEEYTKTTPPHVKAARQLPHLESNIIEYCITTEGPEPIQKLRHKLDHGHYIDKQIKPIAEQILLLFNKSFDDIVKNSKQSKLF